MNIFYLHHNQRICAKWHVDKHVVKMILETAQLLCTALWCCNIEAPYKKTHKNHPCAIWARDSKKNWLWLKELGLRLCAEYTYRYKRIHKTQKVIESITVPDKLSDKDFEEPPVCMDDKYKITTCKIKSNIIISYRCYYKYGKKKLHLWKKRKAPKWILT